EPQQDAVEDYANGLALSALYSNFVRERGGKTPAMAAGITGVPWSIQHIADVIDMWTTLKTGPWYERVVLLRGS
ncbi:MAG TPA: hypothetical protein VN685_13385, partial [Rhizomicrobium sp.]|nr:hypothetical protein [Rhizomicrobium sp.]